MPKLTLKILFWVMFLALNLNCNRPKEVTKPNVFDFDCVEHYVTVNDNPIKKSIAEKKYHNLNKEEELYLSILETDIPFKLKDTAFVASLEHLHFKKHLANSIENQQLKEIFSQEFCDEMAQNACSPIYRDLYIFRKNNSITGIAKVCFQCKIVYFVSKNKSWQRFGTCDHFAKLLELKNKCTK